MKFDLENLNPGVFFPFDEDDGSGGVTIRLASAEALSKIEKACVKKKVEYRKGQRFEVFSEDRKKRSDMIWDYVIVGWEGVTDLEDKEIQCTPENKALLMGKSTKFSSFVTKCLEKLTDEITDIEEELEKN